MYLMITSPIKSPAVNAPMRTLSEQDLVIKKMEYPIVTMSINGIIPGYANPMSHCGEPVAST